VKPNPNGGMVVESTPTSVPASGPRPGQSTGGTQATPSTRGTPGSTAVRPAPAGPGKDAQPPATSGIKPPTSATTGGEVPVTPPAEAGSSTTITNGADPGLADPTETALPSIGDLERNLGLRGAHSVSRAFGAFFGLGLILPLARFLIRRLG
ncbi:MAG TPA: hypothetical protein VGR20_00225, partial [Acidimicrobiia bacterium]|nr:hypothetical protein [Acidimicrobiia bacterium]